MWNRFILPKLGSQFNKNNKIIIFTPYRECFMEMVQRAVDEALRYVLINSDSARDGLLNLRKWKPMLGCSFQDLTFVVPGGPNFEVTEFPGEKRKLVELLRETGAEHLIIMTGDSHASYLTKVCILDCN